jgi:hypothetical protein
VELDTPTIRRLRDRLLAREPAVSDRASLPPASDRLTPSQEAALERIAPLAEVLYLTIAADGDLARSECQAIRTAIGTLSDDLLPGPSIELLLAGLEQALAQQGPEARLEAIASRFALDRPEAEAAFSLAAAVALSDDHVADAESALIDKLRRYFGIPAARAAALLDGALSLR